MVVRPARRVFGSSISGRGTSLRRSVASRRARSTRTSCRRSHPPAEQASAFAAASRRILAAPPTGEPSVTARSSASREVPMELASRPSKIDRAEVFVEYTKSICPVCKVVVDAEVNIRDGRVILRKRCPEHGLFEALVYSDAELYMSQLRFNKPGTLPLEFQTEIRHGCPLDCGMCPDHKQHACLGVIEVNTGCNLDCPICFA